MTANVAVIEPLDRVTDVGTVTTLAFELVSVTIAPDVSAGALNVTVPVTVVCDPPTTEVGDTATL